MAVTMIVVGIMTEIETVATTAIMMVDVMMTESGGTEGCFKARNQ